MTLDYTLDGVTWQITIERKDAVNTASTLEEDRPPVIPLIIVYPDGSTGTVPKEKPIKQ